MRKPSCENNSPLARGLDERSGDNPVIEILVGCGYSGDVKT